MEPTLAVPVDAVERPVPEELAGAAAFTPETITGSKLSKAMPVFLILFCVPGCDEPLAEFCAGAGLIKLGISL